MEKGLAGTLVAREIDSVDKELPFLDAIGEAYCGIDNADVIRTYTSCIYMVRYLYRKFGIIEYRNEELEEL